MKKKVLTVDDSRTIRNMLLVTLNNAGFETIQAEIEQENVGDRPVERRLAGRDAAGFVAGPGQAADQLSGDTRVVFHHEDPAKARVHGLHVKHETRRHPTRRRS